MGNAFSSNTNQQKDELKPKDVSQIIDYIATYYILTMDFESLTKLNDKAYCDNLVVLTSDIIERYFTSLEITYLAQRIKDGVETNVLEKDNLVFFNKEDLNNMDIGNDTIKKKRVCIGIAKFYIKISHVFAAIMMTINPVYMYKDSNGNNVKASLYDKKKIPPNVDRTIYRLNICENRLNSLQNKRNPSKKNIHPKMCDVNLSDGNTKTVIDEPGIPELMELYYDDNYDAKSGKFTGMSSKTRSIYESDLKTFYNTFTNNSDMPSDIKSFKDIKLRDYHNNPKCIGPDAPYTKNIENDGSSLFQEYANNIKYMFNKVRKNQDVLMAQLNQIFVYTRNPITKKRQIRISPALTEQALSIIVLETRKSIINLYLNCEKDYTKGLNIYEAIVETKILNTTQSQIQQLSKEKDKINNPVILEEENKEIEIMKNEKIEKEKMEIVKMQESVAKEEEQNKQIADESKQQPPTIVEQNVLGQNVLGQNELGQNVLGQNVLGQNVLGQNELDKQNVLGQNELEQNALGQNVLDKQNVLEQNVLEQNVLEQNVLEQNVLDKQNVLEQNSLDLKPTIVDQNVLVPPQIVEQLVKPTSQTN
jgi:hypothetical protein